MYNFVFYNRFVSKSVFILLSVVLTLGKLSAQEKNISEADKILPVDPQIKIGRLPNGLTYYIRKNSEPQKRAELYLIEKAGSLQEAEDQRGLAHFTEHMAFNGLRDFPKNELINYLQKAGVRFGSDVNAYTNFAETVYKLP